MEMAAMPPCLFTTPPRSSHITKRKWNAMRNGADETSRLAKRLCLDVVWGRMPAYRAQQYAHDALEDGARPVPLLKRSANSAAEVNNPAYVGRICAS